MYVDNVQHRAARGSKAYSPEYLFTVVGLSVEPREPYSGTVETLDEFSNNFAAVTTTDVAIAARRRRASTLRRGLVS